MGSLPGLETYWTASFVLTLPTVEFFDSSRPHMEQELLEPDDEFSSLSTTSFIQIPNTSE